MQTIHIQSGFAQETGSTTFYLVRHAEKADDGTTDPDLSDAGHQRAAKLTEMLADKGIERLYSTSFTRTQQTLTPLAKVLGLEIDFYDPRDTASVAWMLGDCAGKTAVIVGHSNSIPRLANKLIGAEIYPELDESVYTDMWEIVIPKDGAVEHRVVKY